MQAGKKPAEKVKQGKRSKKYDKIVKDRFSREQKTVPEN
jgi:hypothetical protein